MSIKNFYSSKERDDFYKKHPFNRPAYAFWAHYDGKDYSVVRISPSNLNNLQLSEKKTTIIYKDTTLVYEDLKSIIDDNSLPRNNMYKDLIKRFNDGDLMNPVNDKLLTFRTIMSSIESWKNSNSAFYVKTVLGVDGKKIDKKKVHFFITKQNGKKAPYIINLKNVKYNEKKKRQMLVNIMSKGDL